MSDTDTALVDSLKVLDPERPIREATELLRRREMTRGARTGHPARLQKRGLTLPIEFTKSTLRVHKLARNGINLMTTRRAACSCGQLHLAVEGEPSRIWICHCLECQRRTGAVIGNLARFRREQITFNGTATAWKRTGESGNTLTCYFCPTCGSTIYFLSLIHISEPTRRS